MTNRQRAFLSALIYVVKNNKFFEWHRIGVKEMPRSARMYEFHGKILPDRISIEDELYNQVFDNQFLEKPWGVDLTWIGRQEDRLKIRSVQDSSLFYGQDTDYYRFDGWYFKPDDQVKLRDYSQDRKEYLYRIYW